MSFVSDATIPGLAIAAVFIVVVVAVVFLKFAVIIVPESNRVVVYRFGKSMGTKGPGIVATIPFLDQVAWVDLHKGHRYKYRDLLTADNRQISWEIALEVKASGGEAGAATPPGLESALSEAIEAEVTEITRSRRRDELLGQNEWMRGHLKTRAIRLTAPLGLEVVELIVAAIE